MKITLKEFKKRELCQESRIIQEFEEVQVECTNLINRINEGIAKYGGANLSWCSLGSIKHARNCLIEALAAVGGLTDEEIKKYHI